MPFTASHVAAVLPLVRRTPLVPAALVAGSVAPDLVYFLPLPMTRGDSHAPVAVVGSTALLGLAAWVLWRFLLARPARDLLPAPVRRRLGAPPPPVRDAAGALRLAAAAYLSVVVGSLTHIAWDSFTHANGFVVGLWPQLQQVRGGLPTYEWLQWGSGVAGLVLTAAWVVRWYRVTPARAVVVRRRPGWPLAAWVAIVGTPLLVAVLRFPGTADDGWHNRAFLTLSAAIGGFFLAAVAAGASWWVVPVRARERALSRR